MFVKMFELYHVFKTSREIAGVAVQIDEEGPDRAVQDREAYCDCSHLGVQVSRHLGCLHKIYPCAIS